MVTATVDSAEVMKQALDALRASHRFVTQVQKDLKSHNKNQPDPVGSVYHLYGERVKKQLENAGNLLKSNSTAIGVPS